MNKKPFIYHILFLVGLFSSVSVFGSTLFVNKVKYIGPFALQRPLMIDTLDNNNKPFGVKSLLDMPMNLTQVENGREISTQQLPLSSAPYSLNLAGFRITANGYAKANIKIKGLSDYQLFVNGQKNDGNQLVFTPGTYDVVVKYLSTKDKRDSLDIQIEAQQAQVLSIGEAERLFGLSDLTDRKSVTTVELSPDGQYLITGYRQVEKGGKSTDLWKVSELKTGRVIASVQQSIHWMPRTCKYYLTRQENKGRTLVAVDVKQGQETVLANQLPEGSFVISPSEDFLILMKQNEGPKDDADVHEVIEPDDRQPGWRDRNSLIKIDFQTGLAQPLTFGYHQLSLLDISNDGKNVLIMTQRNRLTKRPTTLFSIYRLNLSTMLTDTLVTDDGFLSNAAFSPDGKELVIMASPEGLGGVGKNVPDGKTPNMYDYQLFTMRIADRKVTPLTRSFTPSTTDFYWNKIDGKLYFMAMDRDEVNLFRCDVTTGKIDRIDQPEDLVKHMSFATSFPLMAFVGESASNADRVYTISLTSKKPKLIEDTSIETLKGIKLGACKEWNFVNSKGDTIYGRYYLPANFDASRKYPLIVNYYGGCTPTSRNFDTRYPQHAYASQGYVVYVIQPSGAVGFGQEFASRHVNTAGEGVAEDIIEGTKKFATDHSYVDGKKIGCIGASYGGFMTQYLQTKTDIFAAAISHAGISDHTSYWGEGYWGYSYSEVSMANNYPWSSKDLYVNQSPLFNADKIHTPLLFLHGSADTNVPIGESIQMYTALKLLGRPTAFVVVEGQNHHILDYAKRQKWQNTIFAWFAKWLKDDASWWDAMYPEKRL